MEVEGEDEEDVLEPSVHTFIISQEESFHESRFFTMVVLLSYVSC